MRSAVVAALAVAATALGGCGLGGGGATPDAWQPPPGTTVHWQLQGKVSLRHDAEVYDVDLFDAVPSARRVHVAGFGSYRVAKGENAGIVDRLHAKGRMAVCYVNTGSFEDFRPDAHLFPEGALGTIPKASTGEDWEGERWLDLRRRSWSRFAPILWARFDLAADLGCDGVEPDQNNIVANDSGFAVTKADEHAWYLEVARQAHDRGLSVGMKNGQEVLDQQLVDAYDWGLNEECNQYDECGPWERFIRAGKAVFQVEYADGANGGMAKRDFCAADRRRRFTGILATLALDGPNDPC